jgi:hypothetical protein
MSEPKDRLPLKIKNLRKLYGAELLASMFKKRLDDDLFIEVALLENGGAKYGIARHLLVWRGAELVGAINPPREIK